MLVRTTIKKTLHYTRVVYTRVEETDERLSDKNDPRWGEQHAFIVPGEDAAIEKARTNTLTGWEPHGVPECEAVSSERVEAAPNVDVII